MAKDPKRRQISREDLKAKSSSSMLVLPTSATYTLKREDNSVSTYAVDRVFRKGTAPVEVIVVDAINTTTNAEVEIPLRFFASKEVVDFTTNEAVTKKCEGITDLTNLYEIAEILDKTDANAIFTVHTLKYVGKSTQGKCFPGQCQTLQLTKSDE